MRSAPETISGFIRCHCGTMQGPVAACPKCGAARGCAYCKSRMWIPGSGWTLSPEYDRTTTHGICPWCATRMYGGDSGLVDLAAERLNVPAGYLHVRSTRLITGANFLRIHFNDHTGWAGAVLPPAPVCGA